MVEINNQRKAFLDMLADGGTTDNGRQKTRNHGYDVIVGELLLITPITLANLSRYLKLKSTGAADATSFFSRWWDACQTAWPERLLSERPGRCGIAAD